MWQRLRNCHPSYFLCGVGAMSREGTPVYKQMCRNRWGFSLRRAAGRGDMPLSLPQGADLLASSDRF